MELCRRSFLLLYSYNDFVPVVHQRDLDRYPFAFALERRRQSSRSYSGDGHQDLNVMRPLFVAVELACSCRPIQRRRLCVCIRIG